MRAELVPPIPNGFITYVHTTFMQKVFYIPQCKWKSHIKRHRKLYDLRTGFEVAEGYSIRHVSEVKFKNAVEQASLF